MADRPFMQLYGSDLVGDTLHLSAEQLGAYMLLLIAMWNADGILPNDAIKLARISRVTPARWAKISPDLLDLFDINDHAIWHKRVQKEIEKMNKKREQNAQSGSLGGKAKALKEQGRAVANATISPQRKATIVRATPEPEPYIEKETIVSQKKTARGSRLPADWIIPNDLGKWAVENFGVSSALVRAEADRFKDYWIAQPGQKGVKLDWPATWRNWCRTAFTPKTGAGGKGQRKETISDVAREIMENMENAERENSDRADRSAIGRISGPVER